MSRPPRVLVLPLGLVCALALGACGSGDSRDSGATVSPPPITSAATTPAATSTTTATTPTTTSPAATTPTTAAPAATQTTPSGSGGASPGASSGGAPAGCPNAVGGFIRDLQATDCSVAQSVATAWFDAVHGGAAPDSAIDAAGYRCNAAMAGERASVTCSGSGGGKVAFTASP